MHFTAQTSSNGVLERGFTVATTDAPGPGGRPRTGTGERETALPQAGEPVGPIVSRDNADTAARADEHIGRGAGLALSDAFASKEKTLPVNAGRHQERPRFETGSAVRFFVRHLGGLR